MSGTYTEITESEMNRFLCGKLGFGRGNAFGEDANEKVYDYQFDIKSGERLAIVVYSSIDGLTGLSRDSGSDAIRVVLMWRDTESFEWKAIGSTKRVNRIGTWRKNLRKRLSGWKNMLEGRCKSCGAPLTVRKGEYGKFLGCVRYSDCNYTESYD